MFSHTCTNCLLNLPGRFVCLLGLSVLFFIFPGAEAAAQPDQQPVVDTVYGKVAGSREGTIEVFRGIPYAAPPVDDLRWCAPQDHAVWQGIRPATRFGPACPQPFNLLFADCGEQSEDCLYLNVWTPDHNAGSLPVLVYLHGGAFNYGSSSQKVYDGAAFSSRGAVVVTINYRLGVFGFLAHPALSAENERQVSGNYALLDQIQALHWVQDNIAAFGGDPGNVTLMGESAGSVSVCTLLCSPLARGLFHRAIAMSGGTPGRLRDLHMERMGLASMETVGSNWAQRSMHKFGLSEFNELRSVPWEQLQGSPGDYVLRTEFNLSSMMSMDDTMCIDGYVLPDSPADVFQRGEQMPVPLLTGSLAEEGGMFTMGLHFRDLGHYRSMLGSLFGPQALMAAALYPAENTDLAQLQLTQFISDGFASGARSAARNMSRIQPDCWLYRFEYESPASRISGIGAFHGSEIPYFLGSFPLEVAYGRGSHLLSDRIGTYLLAFMRTGNPNTEGYLNWPRYTARSDELMLINLPMASAVCERSQQYDLIDQSALW